MKTQTIPTHNEKLESRNSFHHFFSVKRESYQIAAWTEYRYGISHDGFTMWNEKSNSFGFDEILLIKDFCDNNGFTFSFFGVKTDSPSYYGSVVCEINMCID